VDSIDAAKGGNVVVVPSPYEAGACDSGAAAAAG